MQPKTGTACRMPEADFQNFLRAPYLLVYSVARAASSTALQASGIWLASSADTSVGS